MKFSGWMKLILQVLLELILSGFSILFVFIRLLFPKRQKNVRGKTILITGAGHGFGRRLAIKFGALGAKVICVGRNHDNTFNTAWEIRQQGGEAWPFECDVRRRNAVFNLASQVYTQIGDVDILINMAGVYPVVPLLSTQQEEVLEIFETNTLGSLWMLQAFVPSMLETNSGQIVQMSSGAAVAPVAHEVAYSASKGAVTVMLDGLQEEFRLRKGCQVKITTIHPYYTSNRHDLPIRFELRFDRMSPDLVVEKIMIGILREEEWVSIPSYMWFFINFMRCIPSAARRRWRDIFYCRVWDLRGEINTSVSIDEPDQTLNKGLKSEIKQPININQFENNGIQKMIPENVIELDNKQIPTMDSTAATYPLEDSQIQNIPNINTKESLSSLIETNENRKERNEEEIKNKNSSDTEESEFNPGPMPMPVRSGNDGRIVLHTGELNSLENQELNDKIHSEEYNEEKEIDSGLKTIAYVSDDDNNVKTFPTIQEMKDEKNDEKQIKGEKKLNFDYQEVENENENEFKICIQVSDKKINSLEKKDKDKDETSDLTKM